MTERVPWSARIPVDLRDRARRAVRLIQVHADPHYTAQQLTEEALRAYLGDLEQHHHLPVEDGAS